MARHEADRENLLSEATALARRAEFRIPGEEATITAGFRADGRLSIWFGADPAVHFDPMGRLRRAFVEGRLYRTQGKTLARLTRVRTAEATELHRHDLDAAELADLLARLRARLTQFAAALGCGRAELLRQVPEGDESIAGELRKAIDAIVVAEIPLAPAIRGKP